MSPCSVRARGAASVALVIVLASAVVLIGVLWFVNERWSRQTPPAPVLTAEAKNYVHNGYLKLSEVDIGAKESYGGQRVVEIVGKITNTGDRSVKVVEVNCVFHDPYGLVVLRERVPIVNARSGGLKPRETKTFRLAFDTIPQSWNQSMPQLVIARIVFG